MVCRTQRLADELTSRAFRGQKDTIFADDGKITERHRFDNRLALAMLARLDKIAAGDGVDQTTARPAQVVAQEWEGFLELIGQDPGPARAAKFLELRLKKADSGYVPAIVHAADLDLAEHEHWTAQQWAAAEAAGLVVLTPPDDERHSCPLHPLRSDDAP